MAKLINAPTYRVKLWWDGNNDNPHFRLGWKETALRGTRGGYSNSIPLPFDSTNDYLYNQAACFALFVNRKDELPFQMEFNRNYLYNDITRAKREHYQQTRPYGPAPERPNNDEERESYWDRHQKQQAAEEKAKELLASTTDAQYAENVKGDKPFYYIPEPGRVYIIDPLMKNVIHLKEEHPVGLCIYFADPEVQRNKYDWALGIYLYLKGASSYLHKTANEYRYLRRAAWIKDEPVTIPERTVSTEGLLS